MYRVGYMVHALLTTVPYFSVPYSLYFIEGRYKAHRVTQVFKRVFALFRTKRKTCILILLQPVYCQINADMEIKHDLIRSMNMCAIEFNSETNLQVRSGSKDGTCENYVYLRLVIKNCRQKYAVSR